MTMGKARRWVDASGMEPEVHGNGPARSAVVVLLHAVRLGRDIAGVGGPRQAAQQVAYALSGASRETRQAVLCLLASQAARDEFYVDLSEVERLWVALDRPSERRAGGHRVVGRRRAKAEEDRRKLQVEAARAVPIVALFSRFGFGLIPRGHNLVTRCPFHDDRHPSLRIHPGKGRWHCFPCGIGGDGIAFVMRLRRLGFAAAVREVAGA